MPETADKTTETRSAAVATDLARTAEAAKATGRPIRSSAWRSASRSRT